MALLAALLPALTTACGGTVESSTSSTSGGSSTSATSGGAGGTTSASSGGSEKPCGGFSGKSCASDEVCDYPDNACGAADGSGVCVPRPAACDTNYDPVCACDGKIYSNACAAQAAGVDVSSIGSCTAPSGQFACGPKLCASGKQYCQHSFSDVGGEPDFYECKPLPTSCGTAPSCACLAGVACGKCMDAAGGALVVVCMGG